MTRRPYIALLQPRESEGSDKTDERLEARWTLYALLRQLVVTNSAAPQGRAPSTFLLCASFLHFAKQGGYWVGSEEDTATAGIDTCNVINP